jgi:hypothetical protein
MRNPTVGRGRLSRWTRVIGGLAALLLLAPLPAMAALTFNGAWSAGFHQTGNPTASAPSYSDSTNNASQQDDLFVDMGSNVGGTGEDSWTIDLTRSVAVSGGDQVVEFAQSFASQFKHGGVDVSVSVKNSKGKTVLTPLSFSASNRSNSFVQYSPDQARSISLASGDYTLEVEVSYRAHNKIGAWKTTSKHHFEFLGL